MYHLLPKQEKKTPQIDIFIQTPDGGFISLNQIEQKSLNQIEQKRQKLEKQRDNYQQQISVNKKLIKNHNFQFKSSCASLLLYMAALGAFCYSPKSKIGEVARWVGISTVLTDVVTHTILTKREKKLKQEISLLKQQERSFA